MRLEDIQTPALILDVDILTRNCERMLKRADAFGVELRPHLKTAKCAEVAAIATRAHSPRITVSTLGEMEHFARAGFKDMTYAVGIAPVKVSRLVSLQRKYGVQVQLLVDNIWSIEALNITAMSLGAKLSTLIEIDCGGGRGGVCAEGTELLELGHAIAKAPFLSLAGVLTHAGQSYHAHSIAEIKSIAIEEREAAISAARRLRDEGHSVPCVSVGSTPTVLHASSMEGVTEIRPGVYMFGDLDQVALGVCEMEDIALSVLATVIGHNSRSNRTLIDAGALALSKDLGVVQRERHQYYGSVQTIDGTPIDGASVTDVHQEHGFILIEGAQKLGNHPAPIGSRVRVVPNHACLTASGFDRYYLTRGRSVEIIGEWTKAVGW